MKVRQRSLVAAILMATLAAAPLAEAKRAGGGKSHGMSRSNSSSQSYQQSNQYSRPAAPAQQPATPQRSGPGVGSMVAAGVAGAAVGAVAANALADDRQQVPASSAQAPVQQEQAVQEEKKGGIPSWIWLLLIAGIAFLLFRKVAAKKKLASSNPYAPNQSGPGAAPFAQAPRTSAGSNTNIFGQSVGTNSNAAPVGGAAYAQSGQQLPDGTEPAAFLRVARQRFNHIQSMNSASNVEEIRRYLTPDLYQSMYNDIMANQDQDVAEFSNLNAMVVESATENGQYIVSVRFTGTVSEDLNSLPQPFAEVWHFVKPAGSTQEWLVAGIQQN